ncbi:family 16 glycosylhydrolase, partial [Flavobacterium sp.]|uniref:family 16 glycosylhydrolase n=1 Tax=Flavobacterium sp. TaxID=239 RepID=UPI00286A50E3
MKKLFFAVLIAIIIISCSTQESEKLLETNKNQSFRLESSSLYSPSGYSLVWEDNFDSFNTNNWSVGCKDAVSGDIIPGAAGTYLLNSSYDGYITAEDSYASNGSLILRNQKRTYTGTSPAGTYQYTTGWINSMHKVYLNKGYIEVRAQFPSGDKVWPAIWLAAEDLVWGPEWDLWEYFGQRSDVGYDNMGLHLLTGTYPNTKWYTKWLNSYDATFDCEAWHVYGFEWTSTFAKWYIDGVLVHTLLASSTTNWPNENMYLILNNETRTSSPDATTSWPNSLVIDYIQIYQNNTSSFTFSNGGFETGLASPWTTYGTTSISNTGMRTGAYCARIGNNSGFEYAITGLTPNTTYKFSGYIKSGASNQNSSIAVKDYGGNQITASSKSTSYTLKTITFTTGSQNTTATLRFYKTN